MEQILQILKGFSPMATVALALVVIFQLVRQRKSVNSIKDNHLHEVADSLGRIESKLDKMNDNIVYIKTRLNGKD